MPDLAIFQNDHFKVATMTDVLNLVPYVPGRLRQLIRFNETNVYRPTVALEYRAGHLGVLKTYARGSGQGDIITPDKRSLRSFNIPHLPARATVMPDDLPDIRAFGTADGRVAVQQVVEDRMRQMRQDMELTMERWTAGLLKGRILDSDNSVLLDLFAEYNVTPEEFEIDLSGSGSYTVRRMVAEITRYIQDKLGASTYSYLHFLCGDQFYDNLVNSQELLTAYNRPGEGAFLRQLHVRDAVQFAGCVFENYRGAVAGNDFVASDEAIPVPMGVPGLFKQYYGPADTMSAVGRPGQRFVVTRETMKHDTGLELRGQTNTLMLVTRPSVLTTVKDTSTPISGP